MSDPDTSTKELIESIIKSHFEDYEWPSLSGGVSSAALCAEQILEALQSDKKDCISKEEVERALPAKKGSEGYWPGKPPITDQEIGWNDATVAIRKNLGLDDKEEVNV